MQTENHRKNYPNTYSNGIPVIPIQWPLAYQILIDCIEENLQRAIWTLHNIMNEYENFHLKNKNIYIQKKKPIRAKTVLDNTITNKQRILTI